MRKLHYSLFRLTEQIKRRIRARTTPAGRYILVFTLASIIFGANTYATMLYQMGGFLVAVLLISFPLALRFTPDISVIRTLPNTCTAGERLTYSLKVVPRGKNGALGVQFREKPPTPLPTFDEFAAIAETGEEKRNIVDRLLKYYRWTWLVKKNYHVTTPLLSLEGGTPGILEIEANLTAGKRGQLHLEGYTLQRSDPLGIFKKIVTISDEKNILVLPKTYPISNLFFAGSRKYHQGGLLAAAQFGDSQEFIALREYQPGDSIRHIDWKATARAQKPILRQYQDEYYSRYGIILDSFTHLNHCPLFEEAISIAASIVIKNENDDNVVDLLFAGDTFISSVTMGKGLAEQHHMLEILASMETCRNRSFADLKNLVKHHIHLLSGAVLLFIEMNQERKKLITFLQGMDIPFQAVLISTTPQKSQETLKELELLPIVTVVPLARKTKEVRLS